MVHLITGAAQGLGRAMALKLAEAHETLLLSDLNEVGLHKTAEACRALGATVHAIVCDVTAKGALYDAVQALPENVRTPDVIIANAGVGGTNPGYAFSIELDARTLAVNYTGMIHTMMPFVPAMIARGSGSLCGICSMAGLRGLPNAASYCASKAAQYAFLESLRIDLGDAGIAVTCVHPGFIKTPMTEHEEFPMPFMVTPEHVADHVLRAIRRRRPQVFVPQVMGWMSRLNRVLPNWLHDLVARRIAGPRTKQAQLFTGRRDDS